VLEALPADQPSVRLTLAEIETLIGGPLPASAYMRSYWTRSDTARKHWHRLGFAAQLSRAELAVTFTRRGDTPRP
jgi:hypothetical protein